MNAKLASNREARRVHNRVRGFYLIGGEIAKINKHGMLGTGREREKAGGYKRKYLKCALQGKITVI